MWGNTPQKNKNTNVAFFGASGPILKKNAGEDENKYFFQTLKLPLNVYILTTRQNTPKPKNQTRCFLFFCYIFFFGAITHRFGVP